MFEPLPRGPLPVPSLPRCLQIVVPNVMGLVLYQPSVSPDTGVSLQSEAFCRSLVSQYRINFFDQLVYHDQDVKIEQSQDEVSDEGLTLFFKLCSAAGAGNLAEVWILPSLATVATYTYLIGCIIVQMIPWITDDSLLPKYQQFVASMYAQVRQLIREGADASKADYDNRYVMVWICPFSMKYLSLMSHDNESCHDYGPTIKAPCRSPRELGACECSSSRHRTALHIAACEGHASVCEALLNAGADLNFKDR